MDFGKFLNSLNTYLKQLVGINSTKLGLDIEPSSSLLIQLSGKKSKPLIQNFAIEAMPQAAVTDEQVRNIEELKAQITALVQQSNVKKGSVAIAAPGSLVISKKVPLKDVNNNPSEALAWAEARKAFPGLTENLYLDFTAVEELPKTKDAQPEQKLLLIAARKKELQDRLNAIITAGLTPKVIDVDYYCLHRSFPLIKHQIPAEMEHEFVALLNIDTVALLLTVIRENELVYNHRQSYTGSVFTQLTQQYLHLSDTEITGQPVFPEGAKDTLQAQTKRLLQFFQNEFPGKKISKVIVCGRVAVIPGIVEIIAEALSIPAELADPLSAMKMSDQLKQQLQPIAPAIMIGAGLAMRGLL